VLSLNEFSEIWAVDFEYKSPDGERPEPHCMVARELITGRLIRLWKDEFGLMPPFPIDKTALFVAYAANAELNCFRVLGWPMPERILDLYVEFRRYRNKARKKGSPPVKYGLLSALAFFGLDHIGTVEKTEMRDLAIRGGPFTPQEKADLIDYCQSDVDALWRLLPVMAPNLDRYALLRGRYMAAVSAIEHNGVPIDVERLDLLRNNWDHIKDRLIAEVDAEYHCFEGRVFKRKWFEGYLQRKGISWPRHESGCLDLSDETFSSMASIHPCLQPLYALRSALSKLRLSKLAVGKDGRNRATLFPFQSCTGRNQPSNSQFIFGPHVWLRGLIKPDPGCGLAYVDWSQQEVGIAAALSKDPAMLDAYRSGDIYLSFAKRAGALPPDAERGDEHTEAVRELYKQCILGVQYGMSPFGLAGRIKRGGDVGTFHVIARSLLRAHHEIFEQFWRWSQAAVDCATQFQALSTTFGWSIRIDDESNTRSLQNFPMQAGGAEMLRLACCLATERGIEVCAPVHDALLIHAPLDRLEDDIRTTRAAMAEASRIVLRGFELGTEVKDYRYPGHYMDEKRGRKMWDKVWSLIGDQDVVPQKEAA